MQKTKSSSQTGTSSIRPLTVSSNFKFEKVEKLNQLVQELGQTKKGMDAQGESTGMGNPPQKKGEMSEKVLDVLKQRIKANYDQLYSNYPENKTKILKQIQTVETNIAGENAMNHKYQEVIKEKSKYDKIKATVQEKQRKLKKLMDLRSQLKQKNNSDNANTQVISEQQQKVGWYEQKKEQSEHNNLIFNEMLKQRKIILLTLRERCNRLTDELKEKKEKNQKLCLMNHKKKEFIGRLEQNLQKEEQFNIPAKLAQELSSKLQMYQNQHSYSNILHHEAILEEQRFLKLRQDVSNKRQAQRLIKQKKDKEEREQLQELHTLYAIKQMESQKIKRLCGVESIEEVISSSMNLDRENLDHIDSKMEKEISQYEKANKELQNSLVQMVSKEREENLGSTSIENLQKRVQEQEKMKRLLQRQYEKKRNVSNQWLTIMHLINNSDLSKQGLNLFINQIVNQKGHDLMESVKPNQDRKSKSFKYGCNESGESIDFE